MIWKSGFECICLHSHHEDLEQARKILVGFTPPRVVASCIYLYVPCSPLPCGMYSYKLYNAFVASYSHLGLWDRLLIVQRNDNLPTFIDIRTNANYRIIGLLVAFIKVYCLANQLSHKHPHDVQCANSFKVIHVENAKPLGYSELEFEI
jgi:hypothetical protein